MKLDIGNYTTLNLSQSRSFTIDINKENPLATEVNDLADVMSYLDFAQNEGYRVAGCDNKHSYGDIDNREGRVLLQHKVETRQISTAASLEERREDDIVPDPKRVVTSSDDNKMVSDYHFQDGQVQRMFEQRVLEDGRAEVFKLSRNENGTITVSFGIQDQPETR